jgi:hypothetical protein
MGRPYHGATARPADSVQKAIHAPSRYLFRTRIIAKRGAREEGAGAAWSFELTFDGSREDFVFAGARPPPAKTDAQSGAKVRTFCAW